MCGSPSSRPRAALSCLAQQDSTDEDAGNELAVGGMWRLGKLQRSLALMMLTWATRLQDPVLSSQARLETYAFMQQLQGCHPKCMAVSWLVCMSSKE